MNKAITLNEDQALYVIQEGKVYTCLGFDVALQRIKALEVELSINIINCARGSLRTYEYYLKLIEIARQKNLSSGWRSTIELYAPFIGYEGRRVEVEYVDGIKERFYIGKSTGFIPCHIMIKKSNSSGGCGVLGSLIKNFKFIGNKKR